MKMGWSQLSLVTLLFCNITLLQAQSAGRVRIACDFHNNLTLSPTLNFGDSLVLNSLQSKGEWHAGLWIRQDIAETFFQLELLLINAKERYQVGMLNSSNSIEEVEDDRYFIDVPILFGIRSDLFNFYGGITPRVSLNQPNSLSKWFVQKREQTFVHLKYTLGIGLDLGSLKVDFRYHNNILPNKDRIVLNNHPFQLINNLERFSISAALDFLR